jgi:uncharacterized protein (TIGR03067 family)
MGKSLPLLLVLLSLGFAPAPFSRPDRQPVLGGDLKALQGNWVATNENVGPALGRRDGEYRIVVTGSRLSVYIGDDLRTEWIITLDQRANPRGMTMNATGRTNSGRLEAVYSVEGNTFTFCYPFGADSKVRPAALTSGPGRRSMTLKRTAR